LILELAPRRGHNGESNRDGANDNRSWNCGVEGPTYDPAVEKLRNRQVKNLLTCTMLSLGMPMIAMGDEVRRTQLGNNNAYCQDNETSWFDWSLVSKNAGPAPLFKAAHQAPAIALLRQ
jgi:glycogen operon protein